MNPFASTAGDRRASRRAGGAHRRADLVRASGSRARGRHRPRRGDGDDHRRRRSRPRRPGAARARGRWWPRRRRGRDRPPVSVSREAERHRRRARRRDHVDEALRRPSHGGRVEGDVDFAASQDGGFIWPDFLPAYDATATLVKLLDLLAGTGRPLSSVVSACRPSTSPTRRCRRRGSARERSCARWSSRPPERDRARRRREGPVPRRLGARAPGPRGSRHPRVGRGRERPDARRLAQEYAGESAKVRYPQTSGHGHARAAFAAGPMGTRSTFATASTSGWGRRQPRRVGITDFAQDALGDVVFVQLPGRGRDVAASRHAPRSSRRSRSPTSTRRWRARSPR